MLVGDSVSGAVGALLCDVAVAVTIRMEKKCLFCPHKGDNFPFADFLVARWWSALHQVIFRTMNFDRDILTAV